MAKQERKFDNWYTTVTTMLKELHYQGVYDKEQAKDDFDAGTEATEVANRLMNQQLTQLDEEEEDDL